MNIEIERKFLIKNDDWKSRVSSQYLCTQGYLVSSAEKTVRVRTAEHAGFITIKGAMQDSFSHSEFEYEIPLQDAIALLSEFCGDTVISKTRYIVPIQGSDKKWEVDVFHGESEGLVVAEIELESEDEFFEKPDWLGEEVTGEVKYYNSQLLRNPFKIW